MMNAKQFIIYTAPSGAVRVDVLVQGESVWLTPDQLAQLFGRERSVIAKHVKNIFSDGELLESATCAKFAQVRQEGGRTVTREVDHYNLDVIISVGYRVNSFQATQFRIWATTTLREFITKGFVLDDERLQKTKGVFGKDYFDELLERIREIRNSERGFYQKITDVYALSVDYLNEAHIDELNRIVSAYLALAENRAKRGIVMTMADCSTFLTSFLELSNYPILQDKGTVSALEAKLKAEGEYEIFRQRQDLNFVSDFHLVIAQLEDKKKRQSKTPPSNPCSHPF